MDKIHTHKCMKRMNKALCDGDLHIRRERRMVRYRHASCFVWDAFASGGGRGGGGALL